ncbi:hypothetical protein HJFPF1_07000 [Paramyrothecium foliicola]|nr:hypothetical protein HJFPF1_07000 [Paramyrothecium foliicola]
MDRGRSRSRGRYDYDYGYDQNYAYRSPSYSRSPSPVYGPRKLRTRSATRATTSKHSALRTTAGVLAGVGLATFAVHKLFPRDKDDDYYRRRDRRGDLDHDDGGSPEPRAVKERLRRQGDAIVARNRGRRFEDENGPVHHRTTVRRSGDSVVYEDVVPARDVDGGLRGHRAMEAQGFERVSRRRSLDDGRWDGDGDGRGRRHDGRGQWRDEQQYRPDDRAQSRRDWDRDYQR